MRAPCGKAWRLEMLPAAGSFMGVLDWCGTCKLTVTCALHRVAAPWDSPAVTGLQGWARLAQPCFACHPFTCVQACQLHVVLIRSYYY